MLTGGEEQMTIEDFQLIAENMKLRRYEAGETIFKYGDHGSEFFMIIKGEVNMLIPKLERPETAKKVKKASDKSKSKRSQFLLNTKGSHRTAEADSSSEETDAFQRLIQSVIGSKDSLK